CSTQTAKRWRARYRREGLGGLRDRARPGRPLVHGPETRARLIALACTRPPETASGQRRERWTHWELARQVGVSESQAHGILRAGESKPRRVVQLVVGGRGPE